MSPIGQTEGFGDAPGRQDPPDIPGLEIDRLIGSGGFGSVWLAWQSAPARRRVAVKLMRHPLASEVARRQFDLEQSALASLQHPSIATLHMAGIDRQDRPFVVMEWVEGEPITTWCDTRRVGLQERAALLVQACSAVQHAHLRGILHCDLKPANVLVTERDGVPLVKVIDFGLTRPRTAEFHAIGVTAPILGTPGYMSPEQAAGGTAVDGRTDVWSMGVLLVDLLAGAPPNEAHRTPSSVVTGLRAERAADAAHLRATDPQTWCQQLRSGPDWIAARALAIDPEARYASVDALGSDIGRWMHHEPLEAATDSSVYRAKLFVRRNPWGSAAAAAALVFLVVGGVVSTMGWIEARAQFVQSQLQLSRANEVLDFTRNTVLGVSPEIAKASDTTLMKLVLAESGRRLAAQTDLDPLVRHDLADMLGHAYFNIGAWPEAESFFTIASSEAEQAYGPDANEVLWSKADLAEIDRVMDRVDEAVASLRQIHAVLLERNGRDDHNRLVTLASLGWALAEQGQFDQAKEMLQEVLARRTALLGADDPSVLQVRANLTEIERVAGRPDAATTQGRQILADRQRVLGADHPDTLVSANNLGVCLIGLKSSAGFTEAIAVLEPASARADTILGGDHPYALRMANNLAAAYREAGDAPRAEAAFRAMLPRYERAYGPQHTSTLILLNNLSLALEAQGKLDEAIEYQRKALTGKIASAGNDAPTTAISRLNLGRLLLDTGHPDEALAMISEARAVLLAKSGIQSKATMAAVDAQARALASVGRRDEACDLLRGTINDPKFPEVVPGVAFRVLGRLAWLLPEEDPSRAAIVTRAQELAAQAGGEADLKAMLDQPPPGPPGPPVQPAPSVPPGSPGPLSPPGTPRAAP